MGQVFIEDYVVSFLKQKKMEATETPVKLALYGHIEKEEDTEQFFVYGAACEESGRTVEEIGQEFFAAHSFIGFVNVYNNEKENISKYSIFFDNNEAMQDYLLFYNAQMEGSGLEVFLPEPQSKNGSRGVWDKLKIMLLGGLCILVAVAISAIDDYSKMEDFARTAEQAIVFIEETE